MSIDDLLKPRYKVIEEDTSERFKVGDIIQFDEIYPYSGYSYVFDLSIVSPEYFDKYPHLFRLMHWSEERKPEDMPKYVKLINTKQAYGLPVGTIRQVTNWEIIKNGSSWLCDSFPLYISLEDVYPATEQQYLDYQKSIL